MFYSHHQRVIHRAHQPPSPSKPIHLSIPHSFPSDSSILHLHLHLLLLHQHLLSFRAKTLRVFPYLWYELVLDTLTHRDDIPTNTNMFTPQKTIRIRMRSDLDKFLHELTHTWDANAASSVKYFIFLEFANTSTGYPEAVEELVKSLKVILDKCSSLRVLAFHKDCCPTPTSTELTVSAMKKVADELLGHHPILSRLAQYDGSILHEDLNDHTTTWALISKREDQLRHWMLTPKAVRIPRPENPFF
jgi:hypothetical protein